jgi:hypothetical protein
VSDRAPPVPPLDSGARAALTAILALAAVLAAVGIGWGLPWHMAWAVDDLSPWKPLSLPFRWWAGSHKYPYLHFFVSLGAYAPYLGYLLLRGRLDPDCLPSISHDGDCFADPFGAPGTLMAISRALSLAMALGIVAGSHRLAREVGASSRAALLAALAAATSGVLVLYARVGTLDVPVTFWLTWTLVAYVAVVRRGRRGDYLAFGVLLGATLATKDVVAGLFVLPCLAILALHLARARGAEPPTALPRALVDPKLLGLVVATVGIYVLVNNLIFNWEGFQQRLAFWQPGGEHMQAFRNDSRGSLAFLAKTLRVLRRHALGTPLFALATLGLALGPWRRRPSAWLLLPLASYAGFTLAVAGWVPVRFWLPAVPLLAVFAGLAADALLSLRGPLRAVAALGLAAVFAHAAALSLHSGLLMRDDGRHLAEAWLREHVPTDARIATWSRAIDLPRIDWLGYDASYYPDDKASRRALLEARPEWILVSGGSPGSDGGSRPRALRTLRAGLPGYRLAADLRAATPLDRWFRTPVDWLNPAILIFAAEQEPDDEGSRTIRRPPGGETHDPPAQP